MREINNEKIFIYIILIVSFLIKIFLSKIINLPNFVDAQAYASAGFELINFFEIKKNIVMPLYSIIAYFDQKIFSFYILNILFSTINIYLVYLITKKIFSSYLTSIISALLMAFYPFNIFYSITGFSETFFLTLLILGLYFLYENKIILCSIFFVLSILCRPLGEIIFPIIITYFSLFIFKNKKEIIFFNLVKYFVIYIILMSPWWYHNYLKYGKFVRLNLGSNFVLFVGNNSLNKTGGGVIIDEDDLRKFPERYSQTVRDYDFEIFRGKPGFEVKIDHVDDKGDVTSYKVGYEQNEIDPAFGSKIGTVARTNGVEHALLRDKYFKEAAINYIVNNPLKFLENMFIKFKRFWSIAPNSHEFRDNKFYTSVFVLSIVLLLIFSIFGFISNKNFKNLKLIPLYFLLIYVNLIHMIMISSIRYRFIIEWILLILASYYLSYIFNRIKK